MFRKCISSVLIIQFLYPKVTPFVSKISLPLQASEEYLLNDRQGVQGGASLFCIKICGKGELLITIMSSLAQEESRSISENVT